MIASVRRLDVLIVAAAILAVGPPARASVVRTVGPFDVTFYNSGETDNTNSSQQSWTTSQMDDVAASIEAWQSRIQNAPGRQIQLHMFWYNFGGSTLGATFACNNGDGATSWTYAEHAWRDGVNYSAPWGAWDAYMQFDTDAAGSGWNIGAGVPSASQIDFRSVITHELGHALGFWDTYNSTAKKWGTTFGTNSGPTAFAGYNGISRWDQLLRDSAGNMPANNGSGDPGKFNVKDNPVYFVGADASAYNGGSVPVYAPNPYSGGSSLSHLDYGTFPDALMSPFISPGNMQRYPTSLEWEIMKDIGWRILILGDASRDGLVDSVDFTILKANFGLAGGWSQGDFTYDGLVDSQDFTYLKANFGQSLPAASLVPEPASAAVLMVVLAGAIPRRRARAA